MHVLLTTDTIGGVWTFTKELTEHLLTKQHVVSLVSFGREPSRAQQRWCGKVQAEHPDAFTYQSSIVPLEWMAGNETACVEGFRFLLDVIDRVQPDILHSNQYCFGNVPIPIPKLITAHSDVLSWASICEQQGLQTSPWLDRYREMVQAGLDAADAVVAPTRWMLAALSSNFRVPFRSGVIPNGRGPTCDGCKPAQRLLQAVSVGRLWDEAKGLSTLLALQSPVPILVAGDTCFEATSVPSKPTRVRFLGTLVEEELFGLFRQSSIYVAASMYEPFGLAPLEAALCGCAIVARDIPSLREVWGDGATYFRSVEELERVLEEFVANETALQHARTASKFRAEEFSAARMTKQYLVLYSELLADKASDRATEISAREIGLHAA